MWRSIGIVLALAGGLAAQTLQEVVDSAARAAVQEYGPKLIDDRIAISVIDLENHAHPMWASHNGESSFYPASVVKLFYLAAAHASMESGKLPATPELERAIHDMIVSSSNDATQYVFSVLTGTTGGPELTPAELKPWLAKREVVNQYFTSLGFKGINVNQPTFAENPYGRERQARGPDWENGNRLTTESVARLWLDIVSGSAVTEQRSKAMLRLLRRDPFLKDSTDEQATLFSGKALPPGSQYYSKAGWTSAVRHDSAWVRLPNGAEYILAVFTRDNSSQAEIVPFVAARVVAYFQARTPRADLLLTNARVWTGNTAVPWTDHIAVRGDRIVDAHEATRVMDLHGRLVLPGFIDDHTHFIDGGFELLGVNLRDAATQAEFARRIGAQAKKLGTGRWVMGGAWDHELWPGSPLPTKEWIDGETGANPVAVWRLDGHMLLANTVALRLAGVMKATPDPPGGVIVRDATTGEPTGILKDAATRLVTHAIPEPRQAQYEEALSAAMNEAARNGVTSIDDITLWPWWPVYERARDAGKLSLRIYARTPISAWKRQAEFVERLGPGDEWLRLGGLKGFMDGSLGSTTALLFEPYLDAPGTSGLMAQDNLPEGKLRDEILAADAAGLQCSVHAIGDRANHLLLDYFAEAVQTNGARDRRFRIEHAQHLLPADIPRFAQLHVIASVQPYHLIDDGRWAEKRIGPERAKTTYAFRSLLDSGATIAFGSDWTVAPISPLLGIYAAVTRATLDGKRPAGWIPEQKISVEEAVRAYTTSGAFAEFSERDKGALEAGKLADLVVLTDDIFSIPSEKIRASKVALTMVGGKVVWQSDAP